MGGPKATIFELRLDMSRVRKRVRVLSLVQEGPRQPQLQKIPAIEARGFLWNEGQGPRFGGCGAAECKNLSVVQDADPEGRRVQLHGLP